MCTVYDECSAFYGGPSYLVSWEGMIFGGQRSIMPYSWILGPPTDWPECNLVSSWLQRRYDLWGAKVNNAIFVMGPPTDWPECNLVSSWLQRRYDLWGAKVNNAIFVMGPPTDWPECNLVSSWLQRRCDLGGQRSIMPYLWWALPLTGLSVI